jgi:hypothetical protein
MFLANRAVELALRSRCRKRMGGVIDHMSQEHLQNVISWANIYRKRFYLAEEVPLCSSNLQGKFGYNANTKIARAILAGIYEYPPDCGQATREIFEKCTRIRLSQRIQWLSQMPRKTFLL